MVSIHVLYSPACVYGINTHVIPLSITSFLHGVVFHFGMSALETAQPLHVYVLKGGCMQMKVGQACYKYVAVTGRKRSLSELTRLVISLECFIEITPDFLCPFMND